MEFCLILIFFYYRGCDFKSFKDKFLYCFYLLLNGTDISSIFFSSVEFNISVVDMKCSLLLPLYSSLIRTFDKLELRTAVCQFRYFPK